MRADRRIKRSNRQGVALRYQLAASAQRARFSSLVLGEELGLVVADAGDARESEEIAALAPFIARNCELWHGRVSTARGERMVTIRTLESSHGRLYLSGVGGQRAAIVPELRRSGQGVCRILK